MTTFVLIVLMFGGHRDLAPAMTSAEFSSKAACYAALTEIAKNTADTDTHIRAVCVPKS